MRKRVMVIILALCLIIGGAPITKQPIQAAENEVHITKVISGYTNTFAIDSDSNLWGWGDNIKGYLSTSKVNILKPTIIMENVREVRSGISNTFFVVKNDNSLWVWGDNLYGQVGNGTEVAVPKPIKILEDVKEIITNDTSVYVNNS